MSNKLKELIMRAVWVAYWRDGDIDTEDGTFASTDTDEIIRLESAIQELFGGMEANDLVGTGNIEHYTEIAIKNNESTELEHLRKERDELRDLLINVLHASEMNTGNEPSLSVFHRSVDEALDLLERLKES